MSTLLEDMRAFFSNEIDTQQTEINDGLRDEIDPLEAFDNTTNEFIQNVEATNLVSQEELDRIALEDQDEFGFFAAKDRLNKKIHDNNLAVKSTETPNEFVKRFIYNLFVIQ